MPCDMHTANKFCSVAKLSESNHFTGSNTPLRPYGLNLMTAKSFMTPSRSTESVIKFGTVTELGEGRFKVDYIPSNREVDSPLSVFCPIIHARTV